MALFNKSDLLRSANDYVEVEIKLGEQKGGVLIRPLSASEDAQIEAIKVRGLTVTVDPKSRKPRDIDMPLDKTAKNNYDANVKALEFCLKDYTPAEIQQLPPTATKLIAEEIFKLSGVTSEADEFLKTFRENGGSV